MRETLAAVSMQTLTGELALRRPLTTGNVPPLDSRKQLTCLTEVSIVLSLLSCARRFSSAHCVALVFGFVHSRDMCPVSLQLKYRGTHGLWNGKDVAAPDILRSGFFSWKSVCSDRVSSVVAIDCRQSSIVALSMSSRTELQHCAASGLAHLSSLMPANMREIRSLVLM